MWTCGALCGFSRPESSCLEGIHHKARLFINLTSLCCFLNTWVAFRAGVLDFLLFIISSLIIISFVQSCFPTSLPCLCKCSRCSFSLSRLYMYVTWELGSYWRSAERAWFYHWNRWFQGASTRSFLSVPELIDCILSLVGGEIVSVKIQSRHWWNCFFNFNDSFFLKLKPDNQQYHPVKLYSNLRVLSYTSTAMRTVLRLNLRL